MNTIRHSPTATASLPRVPPPKGSKRLFARSPLQLGRMNTRVGRIMLAWIILPAFHDSHRYQPPFRRAHFAQNILEFESAILNFQQSNISLTPRLKQAEPIFQSHRLRGAVTGSANNLRQRHPEM